MLEFLVALLGIAAILALVAFIVNALLVRRRLRELQDHVARQDAELHRLRRHLAPPPSAAAGQAAAPPGPAPVSAPPPVIPAPLAAVPPVLTAAQPPPVSAPPAVAPAPAPPVHPPAPPMIRPPATAPRQRAFDWEKLLGIHGAAALGGIAAVIGAILFLNYALDQGWFGPGFRVATILAAGVGGLLVAEFGLRRRYPVTAHAVCGAGIAMLYAGFYAGHGVHQLFSLPVAFAGMIVVTVIGCVLALRYEAIFVALLGLLGGFATPLLLSSLVDRPLPFFAYLLLLDLGLLAIAIRRGWITLGFLSLLGTGLLSVLWCDRFLVPDRLLVVTLMTMALALVYLVTPLFGAAEQRRPLGRVALFAVLLAFVFAWSLTAADAYTSQWPLLFGFIACLEVALIVVGLASRQPGLILAGAIATTLTLWSWSARHLDVANVTPVSLAVLGLVVVGNLPPALVRGRREDPSTDELGLLETAALVATGALAVFATLLVTKDLADPPGAFLALLAALFVLAIERSRRDWLDSGVAVLAPAAVAVLAQFWLFRTAAADTLGRCLAVPVLVAVAWSAVTGWRQRRAGGLRACGANAHEGGVLLTLVVAGLGLVACLGNRELGGNPVPLFATQTVLLVLLVIAAVRRDWTFLFPIGLVATALLTTVWHLQYFERPDLGRALPFYIGFYLAFLALPFLLPRRWTAAWTERHGPWLAAALSGPLLFLVLHHAIAFGWGKRFIGALPLVMGGLSLLALLGVRRRFSDPALPALATAQRLRHLAWFGAVALGFLSVAIPLQLHRQWITVGWAVEAAAVCWLYGRVPHRGLKIFGGILFLLVGARLLVNPCVLQYAERGWPVINWLLYTYGVPAVACFAGAAWLRRADTSRPPARRGLTWAATIAFLGLVLVFALINVEIADYFSSGRYVEFDWQRRYDRDLTTSVAWGLYALVLLGVGLWRNSRPLRFVSLGFMILTVGKVFLYDLASLRGLHRVGSFLGLAIALVLVSVLYQRFVFRKEEKPRD
ncbi:DUF2339 domain-containing protein [bacterium]|nr:DUF2339 domain-containing protein [bacterium]